MGTDVGGPLPRRPPDPELAETPLLPPGFGVPASRWADPATTLRRLLATEPFVFAPGVYDPHGAELAMYHGAKAVYFSGYSFAIGHLGTTDMDLYTVPEIADGARRTVCASSSSRWRSATPRSRSRRATSRSRRSSSTWTAATGTC